MKRKIRLSESELYTLLNESVKSILNEISIRDKYQKETQAGKNRHPYDLFTKLCSLDPTTTENKVGKYSNWILQKYNPDTDINVLRRCMEWYADGIKRNILQRYGVSTDINSFRTYDELISTMEGVMKSDDSDMSASEYNNRQKLEGQFKVLGSTSTYSVVQPLTFEAERYFGSGTEWCTVGNENYFKQYTRRGPLFILYPKDGNKEGKMQFHFESDSFADYEDNVYEEPLECMENVVYDENEMSGLSKLCTNIWKDKTRYFMTFEEYLPIAIERISNGENPKDIFDWVDDFREGIAKVVLKEKWNLINQNGELINPNRWYNWIGNFNEGFAKVKLKNRDWNFINQNGDIAFPDKCFCTVDDFSEGYAKVELRGQGCNFINQNGDYLSPNQWFDYAYDFSEGYAKVYLIGKGWNLINQNGKYLSPNQWYDETGNFREGFAWVELNYKYNFINQNGDLLSPNQWFDNVDFFREGFARVNLNGEGNFINQKGEYLSPNQWFDNVISFSKGFAKVILDREIYYINGEGELYDMNKNFIKNLRESVSERKIDIIIESTLRKYLRK